MRRASSHEGSHASPWSRRRLLKIGAACLAAELVSPVILRGRVTLAGVDVTTRAVDLVRESPVVDMLSLLTLDWEKLWRWQGRPELFDEPEFRRLESSGINVFHPAVKTGNRDAHATAVRWLDGWNRLLAASPCFLSRVDGVADLDATRPGPVGVIVGFQDSDHFRNVADVASFFAAGQRVSQLTYNASNRIGHGCLVNRDRGLSSFGVEIVEAMNRSGMAVDVSHCGERTSLDAIEASKVPVLVTHSNCAALVPGQPRCKSDELIRALVRRGGAFGVTGIAAFVSKKRPTLADLLDHFDHVAAVAGVECLGLGSDVDVTAVNPRKGSGIDPIYSVAGLVPEARVYQIADGLLRRGWAPRDVQGVLGGNFIRVLSEIWPPGDRVESPWHERRDPFCPAPARAPSDAVRVVSARS